MKTHGPVALLALLTAAAVGPAADPVTKLAAPAQADWRAVQADPVLTVLTTEKPARWVLVDEGPQCELRPTLDGKLATFAARAAGQYRVLVVTADDVHRVKVIVADAPQPMPGPVDPPKPDPKPEPPKPAADPDLVKKFQAAFDAEVLPAEKKREAIRDKVELYRQAAVLASDPEVTTTGELVTRVKRAADTLHTDQLLLVRKAVRAELQAAFPTDEPLTAESRTKAAALFTKIKVALEAVK